MDGDERKRYIAPFIALENGKDAAKVEPIPPLDVAFCWALHRLSPLAYEADCKKLFGALLPTKCGLHYIGVHNAEKEEAVIARLQWTCFARAVRETEEFELFCSKACRRERKTFLPSHLWPRYHTGKKWKTFPFDEPNQLFPSIWVSPLEYNLVAAAARQKQFLYNVSGTYYDNDAALIRGAKRYHQFLLLIGDNPGQFLVPMYDIDLLWHAHILNDTEKYVADTKNIVGKFVNHREDDDRKSGSELQNGFKRTAALWQETYSEEYEDDNTNYKGRIPNSQIRVFKGDRSLTVKADDSWRERFDGNVVCRKCKKRTRTTCAGNAVRHF